MKCGWPMVAFGQPRPFIVTMDIGQSGGANPVINGRTNLPDGTKMIVSIEYPNGSYAGQDSIVVNGGQFQAGPYDILGGPYPPGTYTIEITSGDVLFQPPSVQAIIGANGQYMEGAGVAPDTFSNIEPPGSKVIDYYSKITIP